MINSDKPLIFKLLALRVAICRKMSCERPRIAAQKGTNCNVKGRKSQAERRPFTKRMKTRRKTDGCRTAEHVGGESRKHPVRWLKLVCLQPFVRYAEVLHSAEAAAMKNAPSSHDGHASRRSQFCPCNQTANRRRTGAVFFSATFFTAQPRGKTWRKPP